MTQEETVDFLRTFTQKLVLWVSDDVMVRWSNFRDLIANIDSHTPQENLQMFVRFEELLLAIRRDTGHANKGIQRGGILRLFINDLDTVMPRIG
ncbi:hypothetical protein D3C72_2078170 [compost metagenome]